MMDQMSFRFGPPVGIGVGLGGAQSRFQTWIGLQHHKELAVLVRLCMDIDFAPESRVSARFMLESATWGN